MIINFSETKAKVGGVELYSYHSSPSPLNRAKHVAVTAYLFYEILKDNHVVNIVDCFRFVRGNKTVRIKKK